MRDESEDRPGTTDVTEQEVLDWIETQAAYSSDSWRSQYARRLKVMLGDRCQQATPKPPAWVVTWTVLDRFPIGGPCLSDGVSTLASWPAVIDYIERIVPHHATFTVKPA